MSLKTHSKIYYDFEVNETNFAIDFSEGGPELQASLNFGSYSMTDYMVEVSRAMTAIGSQTYSTVVNRVTRKINISATATFSLLVSSGTRIGVTAYTQMGFSGADRISTNTYTANLVTGKSYSTQFILQSYVKSIHSFGANEASINTSASGRVEVIRFGEKNFIECEFKFITDLPVPGDCSIRYNATGVSDFITLIEFMITKAPFEFMADEDNEAVYETMLLESTATDPKGVGFMLTELHSMHLPGFYNSGKLKFRKVI